MDYSEPSRDYERIATAIRHIETHWRDQPDLEELARVVHLSPYHFQRLFTCWAGVSPKRFMGYLTLDHARAMLEESASVLDVALETGLSGPGRLHDLFVSYDAVTPGDVKRRGAGMEICYGFHESPFGQVLLGVTDRGICRLSFCDDEKDDEKVADLTRRWPAARLIEDPTVTAPFRDRVFGDGDMEDPLPLHVTGTNFQIKVWEAILQLPLGRVATYAQISQGIGHPKAARAVGSALNANPVAFLIPCHAVIPKLRRNVAFAPYAYGTTRRAAMLGWEAGRAETRERL
ncbi:putative Transcriptional regulator, AraC family protein [Magnetospira sp. QH-2]|nr:putative Transcriptional regulator, AraC family protein [Magnetospira sp. QH-2]